MSTPDRHDTGGPSTPELTTADVVHRYDEASMTLTSTLALGDGREVWLTHSWDSRDVAEERLELTKELTAAHLVDTAANPLERRMWHVRTPVGVTLRLETIKGITRVLLPRVGVGRSKNGHWHLRAAWGVRMIVVGRRPKVLAPIGGQP